MCSGYLENSWTVFFFCLVLLSSWLGYSKVTQLNCLKRLKFKQGIVKMFVLLCTQEVLVFMLQVAFTLGADFFHCMQSNLESKFKLLLLVLFFIIMIIFLIIIYNKVLLLPCAKAVILFLRNVKKIEAQVKPLCFWLLVKLRRGHLWLLPTLQCVCWASGNHNLTSRVSTGNLLSSNQKLTQEGPKSLVP